MMKYIKIKGLMATIASATILFSGASVNAAEEGMIHPESNGFTSTGIFGKFDIPSLQRGLQVYIEVCSACHSMDLVAFRSLEDIGYNIDEVKAIAAEYDYEDTFDDDGELITRSGIPADYFPAPFANE